MKSKLHHYTIILIMGFASLLTGCKDDLSTLDTHKLPTVLVDTTGQSHLSVFQFDKLTIDPKLEIINSDNHSFSYEWSINLEPHKSEYTVIGTAKKLDYVVNFVPTKPAFFHQVLLKVTDENTGIVYLQEWPLSIRNAIGEGIVVVETYDDINSDLSHIMSPLVTPNYTEDKIRFKVYSSVNGAKIPGLVNNLIFTQFTSAYVLLGSTNQSLFTIKTLDYTLGVQDAGLFYAPLATYGASHLATIVQNELMVKDGKLYANWLQISRFGLPLPNAYTIPSIVGINSRNILEITLNFYSEELGRFIFQPRFASFGDRVMRPVASAAGPFNPAQVPNMLNVAAGVNNGGDFIHVLKDKATGKHGLYILDAGSWDPETGLAIDSKPKKYADLSGAPAIEQATKFVVLDDQQVILYATKDKIYAIMYGGSTPNYALRYTATAGDEIASLKVYHQADYPKRGTSGEPYFLRNGKQLILGTNKGMTGKIHVLPLINQGLAEIDLANIKTYEGFGKILFTTTQL